MNNSRKPTARKKNSISGKAPVRKRQIYFCFAKEDQQEAEELRDEVETKDANFQVMSFEHCLRAQQSKVGAIHDTISSAVTFVLIVTQNTFGKSWVEYQYQAAVFHANSDSDNKCDLIYVLREELTEESVIPVELSYFDQIDFRDPTGEELAMLELRDRLTNGCSPVGTEAKKNYIYSEIVSGNQRLNSFRRVFRREFDIAFRAHVETRLKTLADIRKAQENLMTPELISVNEKEALDDIWVVSHTLNNDIHNDEIAKSIEANLGRGINYTYFVPTSILMKKREKEFDSKFSKCLAKKSKPDTGEYKFIYIEKGVFMPFDELVIYDGENPSQRWGYIQMTYESTKLDPLTLRVPERTLSTTIDYLRTHLEKSLQCLAN